MNKPGFTLGFTLARAFSHRYHQVMANIILFLSFIFAGLTLASLLVGVAAMGKGGEFNKKNSNKLMRFRVLFQICTVACFALYMAVR